MSHLGCHSPGHFGPIIPGHVIAVGRSSCGVCQCPQVGQVRVCGLHSYFLPVACETMGPINLEGLALIKELGARLSAVTGDPRECSFLLQRISIVIQRSNAVAFRGTFVGEGFYDV